MYICICMRVYIQKYTHIHVYVIYIYIYICIYIYTHTNGVVQELYHRLLKQFCFKNLSISVDRSASTTGYTSGVGPKTVL